MTGLFEESDHCGQPSLKQYLTPARCSAPDQSRPACGQRLPSSNARLAKNECGTMDYATLLCFLCVSAFHETHDSPALQKHVSSARCSTPAHIGMCMCNMRGYHSECSAVVQAHSRRAIAARTIAARTLRARGSTPCLHQATCKSVHTPPNASTVFCTSCRFARLHTLSANMLQQHTQKRLHRHPIAGAMHLQCQRSRMKLRR